MAIEVKCAVCGQTFSGVESAVDTIACCPNCGEARHVLASPAAIARIEQQAAEKRAKTEQKAAEETERMTNEWKQRAKHAAGRRVSLGQFIVVLLIVLAIFYLVAVMPLQRKVDDLTQALESLTRVVNNNADVANYNNRFR